MMKLSVIFNQLSTYHGTPRDLLYYDLSLSFEGKDVGRLQNDFN